MLDCPEDEIHHQFFEAIQSSFSREFCTRIDELVLFVRRYAILVLHSSDSMIRQSPMTQEAMSFVVDARLALVREQLLRVNLHLEVQPEVNDYLRRYGWSPNMGARRLETLIRVQILHPLTGLILQLPDDHDGWTAVLSRHRQSQQIQVELCSTSDRFAAGPVLGAPATSVRS